ncbi:MAG: diguanylate cyclase [Candidatus Omnitrophota bacterium]
MAVSRSLWGGLSLLCLVLILSLGIRSYHDAYKSKTEAIIEQKKAVSFFVAGLVHDKLDFLVGLGVSFASRPRLVDGITKGDWVEAMSILEGVRENFPFIDRLILHDIDGVIKADQPLAVPSVIGQSRADKEWYKEVSKAWSPYVSGVHQRSANPQANVFSIIIPIRSRTPLSTELNPGLKAGKKLIGILQIQIKLDVFREWLEEASIGQGSVIYIVDQQGHLVFHPKFNVQAELIDFSSVPTVRKLLKGESGGGVNYNPVEKEMRVSAYNALAVYGWGIVVTQPTATAFLKRDKELRGLLFGYGLCGALIVLVLVLFYFSMTVRRRGEMDSMRLKAIVEFAEDGIIGKDLKGIITSWNQSAEKMFGFSASDMVGHSIMRLIPPERQDEEKMILDKIKAGEEVGHFETIRQRRDGKLLPVSITASPIKDAAGHTIGVSKVIRDIAEIRDRERAYKKVLDALRAAHDELKELSLSDPLTGLSNRRGLEVKAEQYLQLAKRNKQRAFMFFVDIDNMKQINDTLGHNEGDVVLKEVARILKACFRETDIIARLGGDEFCVLVVMTGEGDEKIIIDKLHGLVEERNAARGPAQQPFTLSIGGSPCDLQGAVDFEALLGQADKMMYIQKGLKKTS